jgi:hypothetical protein
MRALTWKTGAVLAGAASILAPAITHASPLTALHQRATGINEMGFTSIIIAVIDYLKGENAYNPSVPDKCVIVMYTTSGSNCKTYIQCEESDLIGTNLSDQWEVCYLGGEQPFLVLHCFSYPSHSA